MGGATQDCPGCGIPVEAGVRHCPKCDTELGVVERGRPLHVDIAHDGQIVDEALTELDAALRKARAEGYRRVRLIVGGGRIRAAALARLEALRRIARVTSVQVDGRNPGRVDVRL